jgi:NAD(P)-dependent dehydrogenase (short-subunit alcohol dehydrogenase family)
VTMTIGVAREFATQGIRAASISPGPIKTPFPGAAQSSPELVKQFLEDVPIERFGGAGRDRRTGAVSLLFLCSDACPFMTAAVSSSGETLSALPCAHCPSTLSVKHTYCSAKIA